MVPPRSHKISRASWYSGSTLNVQYFAYRVLTFYDRPSQTVRLYFPFLMSVRTPDISGLGSSRFARRYLGNRVFFLFLRVLRCFSSPGCPHMAMDSPYGHWVLTQWGCPIRRPACRRLLATQRSFSQLTASFFVSRRLGIHRMPLLT